VGITSNIPFNYSICIDMQNLCINIWLLSDPLDHEILSGRVWGYTPTPRLLPPPPYIVITVKITYQNFKTGTYTLITHHIFMR